MLILAGVSINAIVGDNGVLTKTTYASFLSEMSAVEEAVQMWKAGEIIEAQGDEVKAIPANGLCNANDLTSAERLVGEVGYYRVWSLTSTMPTTDILSSADTFNSSFESELVFYPAGVQDLYYLNNDALDIKGNKTYLIDATTGMIFSMTGISLKGVRCYSLNMAKAVMNGSIEQPLFAEAEVSGTGSGEKLAGNVSTEYLMDENGNYILDESGNKIKNPDYNPNGFQIIADSSNTNIYKLYNNGDLYAKGVKGYLMNSTEEEMNEINSYIWQEFQVPTNIPGADVGNITLIPGSSTMYVIDSEGYLWAWGSNSYNKLGLTEAQRIEYTGLVPTKLNIDGKTVYKVYPTGMATFVITNTNGIYELYACGYNVGGQLGTGIQVSTQDRFMKVNLSEDPRNIINITSNAGKDVYNLILIKSNEKNKIYFAGSTVTISGYSGSAMANVFKNTDLYGQCSTSFIEIFNGIYGTNLSYNVVNLYRGCDWNATRINMVTDSGQLYRIENNGSISEIKINGLDTNIKQIAVYSSDYMLFSSEVNGIIEFWCNKIGSNPNIFGNVNPNTTWKLVNDYMPENFNPNQVKDFYITGNNVLYLMNDGKVWATGNNAGAGINISTGLIDNFICINDNAEIPLIDSFLKADLTGNCGGGTLFLKGKDGKIYGTGNETILFGEKILQKSWLKIASNVKSFNAKTTGNALGYIDFNNDLWILGADSSYFGMNSTGNIRNFVRLKDYIKNTEMYSHIDGKVVDYVIGSYSLRILTNSYDNNTIYVSGYVKSNTWYKYNGLGVEGEDDKMILTKVIDNVKYYDGINATNFAITKDNKLYSWGYFDGNNGFSSYYSPKELTVSGIDIDEISKITNNHHYNKFLLTNESKLYVAGYGKAQSTVNGLGYSTNNNFTAFPEEAFDGKKIIDVVCCGAASWIVLTEDGNLWGCGRDCDLGVGKTGTEQNFTPIKIYDKGDISQISGGAGWFVVVNKTGKVYGTGTNTYGILGRWIGIDRNTPNSRYKTAFEWVECPELEI